MRDCNGRTFSDGDDVFVTDKRGNKFLTKVRKNNNSVLVIESGVALHTLIEKGCVLEMAQCIYCKHKTHNDNLSGLIVLVITIVLFYLAITIFSMDLK